MGQYAASTEVSSERSMTEIRNTLKRFGAGAFTFGEHAAPPSAALQFEMQGRRIRFVISMPKFDDYRLDSRGRMRVFTAINRDYEQACRQRWRSLALIVKAKLVAVEDQVSSFEEEFAMHFVTARGTTIYEELAPQLPAICETSKMPALLPGSGA